VARFVFVHGAWHGGWCWERLSLELERRGHETWAPDLPCEEIGLTVRDYATVVGPQPDAVVVGHSMGGMTIPLITARVTVFLAALIPVDGPYLGLDPEFTGMLRDDLGRSFWPDLETARERLYPDLGDDDAREAFDRLRPQAPVDAVFELPVGLSASIVTLRDRAIRPDWQARMACEALGVEPLELDAGHSPFLTHPVELADLLESIA
jgi:pimeloyl-ACP methyl ester carboxylesterase